MQRTKCALRPLNNFVILKEDPVPDYHAYKGYSGIIVPDAYKHGPEDRAVFGTVLALGRNVCTEVRVGDHVVVGKWAAARVRFEETEYLFVKDAAILGANGRS